MKKLYFLLASFVITMSVNAQIYSENMGTSASGNPLVSAFTGYQRSAPISYSGTGDVRTTGASTGYVGASGSDCIFFAASGGKTFIISGIDTSSTDTSILALKFGFSSSQLNKNLTVETSTDGGGTWVPLVTVSNPNTSWALKSVTSGIPSSSTLSLRFNGLDASSGGMRIDDVSISNTTLAVSDLNSTKINLVKNSLVKDAIQFSSKANVQIVNTAGQVVKNASVTENTVLNVSSLSKGVYFVTAIVDGKKVSQKIIKD